MAAPARRGAARAARDAGDSGAQRLVTLVEEAGTQLFADDGEAYAAVSVNGHVETYPVRSRQFQEWLDHQFYHRTGGKPAASAALADAVRSLAARARWGGCSRPVHRRVATENGRMYLDLGDEAWRAVEIAPDGWRVLPHPVAFVRSVSMHALPVPVEGGSTDQLWRFVNTGTGPEGAANRSLILAWLMQALLDRGPYPILVLAGEQGSAKSFTAKVLRSLVDPARPLLRSAPGSDRDLIISTRHSHVLAFDNLSYLSVPMSDALCRLSTGGGYATRQLHSDYDEVVMDAIRPVVLTGINELASRSDLLSRCLLVELPRLSNARPEAELWREFEEARPALLGALCTACSVGLRELDGTVALTGSRLVDFDRWAQATERGLAMPGGSFVAAYSAAQRHVDQLALELSAVASAVRAFVISRRTWQGSAGELLAELEAMEPSLPRHPRWPRAGNALGKELKRLAPNLRKLGIDAILVPTAERRLWTLALTEKHPDGAVRAVRTAGPYPGGDLDDRSSSGPAVMGSRQDFDRRQEPSADGSDGSDGWTESRRTATRKSSDGSDGSDGSIFFSEEKRETEPIAAAAHG